MSNQKVIDKKDVIREEQKKKKDLPCQLNSQIEDGNAEAKPWPPRKKGRNLSVNSHSLKDACLVANSNP